LPFFTGELKSKILNMLYIKRIIFKKCVAVTFLFLFVFNYAFSTKIDSLKQTLTTCTNNATLIELYNELCDEYLINTPDSALFYANKMLKLTQKSRNTYKETGALIRIGVIYYHWGMYEKAIQFIKDALHISKKFKYKDHEAVCYNNLGLFFINSGNYQSAILYLEKSLLYEQNNKNDLLKIIKLQNLGLAYFAIDSLNLAEIFINKSLYMANNKDDKVSVFYSYFYLAQIENARKNLDKSLNYLNICFKMSEYLTSKKDISVLYNGAGIIYMENFQYTEAIQAFKLSIEYANQIGLKGEILESSNKYLSEIFNKKGDFEKAYEFQVLHLKYSTEFQKQKLEKMINEIEFQYLILEKENEIKYLANTETLLKKIVRSEKQNKYYLLLVLIFSIIIAVSNLHRILPDTKSIALFVVMAIIIMTLITLVLKYLFILNENTFFSVFVDVLTVATLPIFITVLMTEKYLLNKNIKIASDLNRQLKEFKSTNEENIITIEFNNDKKTLKLKLKELVCIEANENYVTVHYYKCDAVVEELFRGTLKSVYEHLSDFDEIIRCHKSYIVNITYIKNISGNSKGYKLHFDALNFDIPVSRSFPQEIIDKIKNNCEQHN